MGTTHGLRFLRDRHKKFLVPQAFPFKGASSAEQLTQPHPLLDDSSGTAEKSLLGLWV